MASTSQPQGGIEETDGDWIYPHSPGEIRLVRKLDYTDQPLDIYKIEVGQHKTRKPNKLLRKVEVSDKSSAYNALQNEFDFEDDKNEEDRWFYGNSESEIVTKFDELIEPYKT